jgi:hypothetical protein
MHWEIKETVAQRAARIAKEQQELEAKRLFDKQIEEENIRKTKVKYQEDNKDIILTEIHTKIRLLELNIQNVHNDIQFIKEYLLDTIGDQLNPRTSPSWSKEYTVREELQNIREILQEIRQSDDVTNKTIDIELQ